VGVVRDGAELDDLEDERMTESMRLLLLANIAATLFMVGLIWFVQVIHYPQFAEVGKEHFADYHAGHVRRTTWVVAVPMIVEAITAAVLAWRPPAENLTFVCRAGLVLVIVVWISTALFQVPRHNALATSFDPAIHRGLVITNWIRTVSWSLRGLFALYIIYFLSSESVLHGQ
jgi:hypothetical protein